MAPGKEQRLLDHLLSLPDLDSVKGNPQRVLDEIDKYDENVEWFMNVGAEKGEIISERIRKYKPQTLIELGGYVGYSAVYFSKELINEPHAKYYSFEVNPEFAKIAQQVIDLAGLTHKVEIIVGKAASSLEDFESRLNKEKKTYIKADFVFIDHWKDMYVPDLRVLETLNLLAPGTFIYADNTKYPGAPEYVKYIHASPEERRTYNYSVDNVNGDRFIGRWNILYETETIPVTKHGHYDELTITKVVEYLDG